MEDIKEIISILNTCILKFNGYQYQYTTESYDKLIEPLKAEFKFYSSKNSEFLNIIIDKPNENNLKKSLKIDTDTLELIKNSLEQGIFSKYIDGP